MGETLETADGLAVEYAPQGFSIEASEDSELLLFRLN
jgi:hypothetical protein